MRIIVCCPRCDIFKVADEDTVHTEREIDIIHDSESPEEDAVIESIRATKPGGFYMCRHMEEAVSHLWIEAR